MQSLQAKIKVIAIIAAIVAFIGFLDASYLSIEQIQGKTIECATSFFNDCSEVTTSVYSKILGIPVAYLGFLYYAGFLVLCFALIDTKKMVLAKYLGWYSVLGLGASVYFSFIQAFVLKAFCLYCIVSAITSTILFLLGMRMLQLVRNEKNSGVGSA